MNLRNPEIHCLHQVLDYLVPAPTANGPSVDAVMGFRMTPDEERAGADIAIHKISANPEEDVRSGRM